MWNIKKNIWVMRYQPRVNYRIWFVRLCWLNEKFTFCATWRKLELKRLGSIEIFYAIHSKVINSDTFQGPWRTVLLLSHLKWPIFRFIVSLFKDLVSNFLNWIFQFFSTILRSQTRETGTKRCLNFYWVSG